MLPIRTIIHPTDLTENSHYAFQMAFALARDYGANIVLLHVYPTPVYPVADGGALPVVVEVPREKLMKDLEDMTPPDSTVAVGRVLVEGDPAFEILRVANVYDADLIVMGTHGRGGLSRVVMGSVAEAVTRKANCPVLTVRVPLRDSRSSTAKTAPAKEPVEV